MSIDFSMNVKVVRNFYDDNVCEHRSIILDSTLDLGNFRALRSIISKEDDENCGTIVKDSRETEAWLYNASNESQGFQVLAALEYMKSIRRTFAGTIDLSPDENYNPEIEIICTITYA
jgi:hypothetical protein